MEAAGLPPDPGLLDAVFDAGWERYSARWLANLQYKPEDAAAELVDTLGLEVSEPLRADLVDAFRGAAVDADLHATPNVEACLAALKAADVRIGIVCDVGMTGSPILRGHLAAKGLLEYFDHWSFSDEVGVYKPAAAIFEHALAGLGVAPDRAAHIGDIRRTDVAGARAMGMLPIRYSAIYDDQTDGEPEADVVVVDHADLPAALGLS